MNTAHLISGYFDITAQIARDESACLAFLLVSTAVLCLIFWFRNTKTLSEGGDIKREDVLSASRSKLPPGSGGYPLIGETIEFIADGRKFFRTRRQKYGPVFRSHLCGHPTVVVTGSENVERVLTAGESSLVFASPLSVVKLFGRGALTSCVGRRHSQLQRSVMRLFSPRVVTQLVSPVQRIVRGHVARWCGGPSTVVSGSECCQRMLLTVVSQCLFGFDLETEEVEEITCLLSVFSDGVLSFPVNLPGFAFHKAMRARAELDRIIAKRTSPNACNNPGGLSLLGLLHPMEDVDSNLDIAARRQVADLILELIFGAKETTASAMCTALIEISENPEVLTKLRKELLEHKVTPGAPVCYEVLQRLSYLNNIIKEVLRIQPPVAGAFRRTCQPFHIQDFVVPAGWMILYGITDTHEASSGSFEDFNQFDPDRWTHVRLCASSKKHSRDAGNDGSCLEESSTIPTTNQAEHEEKQTAYDISRFEYLPFGGGRKRFCVGKSLAKMILSVFLIELANQTGGWRLPNGRPDIKTAPFPFPKDRLPIMFISRRHD